MHLRNRSGRCEKYSSLLCTDPFSGTIPSYKCLTLALPWQAGKPRDLDFCSPSSLHSSDSQVNCRAVNFAKRCGGVKRRMQVFSRGEGKGMESPQVGPENPQILEERFTFRTLETGEGEGRVCV